MADRRGIPILGDASAVTMVMAQRAVRGRKTSTVRRKTKRKTAKKKAARRAPAKRAKKRSSRAKPARMKKGSPAAKRHMAKLRRMRGK
jgi:hypothetical protein